MYASPDRQLIVTAQVPRGATLRDAIEASGILKECPQIDLASASVGVFGVARKIDDPLAPADRVEIYRSLAMDPKEARRQRVRRQKS